MTSYDAACVHVALARIAIGDQQAPLAERQRRAQRDLDRALELLDLAPMACLGCGGGVTVVTEGGGKRRQRAEELQKKADLVRKSQKEKAPIH